MSRRKLTQAFTLIELLTVIAIIGILAAILLTAVTKVKQAALKAKTREMVYQVAASWEAHLRDFRRFPTNGIDIVAMDTDAISTLNTHARYNQNTDYLEFKEDEKLNGYKDPWGNLIQVALDMGPATSRDTGSAYDGVVTAGAHGEIKRSVVAWSFGPDGSDGSSDDVTSW